MHRVIEEVESNLNEVKGQILESGPKVEEAIRRLQESVDLLVEKYQGGVK